MEALFVLLIFSLILGAGFLAAFFWAHNSGQYEDTETPAIRMLFEDTPGPKAVKIDGHNSIEEKNKSKGVHYGG
jgi:cbb3-type cytochrome oxidase maturation protein